MKHIEKILVSAGVCAILAAAPAAAKPWVDYSPGKGVWEVTMVKVDPNKIDDYLTGLKKSWVPGQELAKKKGIIDDYVVMVKANAADGQGNVMLAQHFVNFAVLDPNKARDMEMEKEGQKIMSDKDAKAMVAGFDKYRTFVGDAFWGPVNFNPKK